MIKSIISNEKQCYVCGSKYNLHYHHIMFGKNRKLADEDGLCVYLCGRHHNQSNEGVHGKNGHELDIKLKKMAVKVWCEYYNKTEEDFRKRYGKLPL